MVKNEDIRISCRKYHKKSFRLQCHEMLNISIQIFKPNKTQRRKEFSLLLKKKKKKNPNQAKNKCVIPLAGRRHLDIGTNEMWLKEVELVC